MAGEGRARRGSFHAHPPSGDSEYRQLFQSAPSPLLIFDAHTLRVSEVNEAALKLYGWSRPEFLRLKVTDLFAAKDTPTRTKERAVARNGDALFGGESRHRRKDRTLLHVQMTVSRIKFHGREARLAVVNEREGKFHKLFENMSEMFQILEPIFDERGRAVDFRYIEVNPATEIVTGRTRAEIEGRTARELWGIVESYWIDMIGEVARTGHSAHIEN